MTTHYQLYRKSTIGSALTDSLEELITGGQLNPELAMAVLAQFDKSMNEALSQQVTSKMNFKGHLHTYRFCDNVWTFLLENAEFRCAVPGGPTETVRVDKVKIVACDGKIGK